MEQAALVRNRSLAGGRSTGETAESVREEPFVASLTDSHAPGSRSGLGHAVRHRGWVTRVRLTDVLVIRTVGMIPRSTILTWISVAQLMHSVVGQHSGILVCIQTACLLCMSLHLRMTVCSVCSPGGAYELAHISTSNWLGECSAGV